jgi:SOS-response transcriptional repressor LexA
MVNDRLHFLVKDDGMIGDRILKGDTVLFNCQNEVFSDEIAVVAYGTKLTLRRVEKIGSRYKLIPSNPVLLPEMHDKIVIFGRVIKNIITI